MSYLGNGIRQVKVKKMKPVEILIVEDSKMFANVICSEIRSRLGFDCTIVPTFKETQEVVDARGEDFFLAVLDLNLPDASNEIIVDYIVSKEIPAIIFTGNFADDMRERILGKEVVDYVLKESIQDVDYLVRTINRLYKNQSVKALVVDDSSVSRLFIRSLLCTQKFEVLEAANGKIGLDVLKENPDIKLVISDYNMPEMDGFEFVSTIRKKFSSDQMAIIGISAHGSGILSAKFLKRGANDFINKPFAKEEFYCRINQNVEMLEYIEVIQDASNKDYLTGMYNRRYFFDLGRKIFENGKRGNLTATIAMLDIDHFKKINDTFGHDAGDTALKVAARFIYGCMRRADIVARFGGEEFCILATNMKEGATFDFFDQLRRDLSEKVIEVEGGEISMTISIGVTNKLGDSLEETINRADELLYKAKQTGRNRVIMD
jgi:diguanylate cyclase (GGDEF)-like protein